MEIHVVIFVCNRNVDDIVKKSQEVGSLSDGVDEVLPRCDDKVVCESKKRNKKVRNFKMPEDEGHYCDFEQKKFAPQSQKKMK